VAGFDGRAYNRVMTTLEVLVPVAAPRIEQRPLARRLSRLSTVRIGWLDNCKANAGRLLDDVAAALRARGNQFDSIRETKNATAAAPDAVMAHLKTCDAVVLAIAD
jgi:predicted glycosyltransferase